MGSPLSQGEHGYQPYLMSASILQLTIAEIKNAVFCNGMAKIPS